jgi:hypothetical protein
MAWTDFLRMQNMFGDPKQVAGMSNIANMQVPQLQELAPRQPQIPTEINRNPFQYDGPVDEEVTVGPERPDLMEEFKQSVLNYPKRTQMTYPDSTLNGLTEALKIAATPTDYEKNRVFVDGHAYQKSKVFKDPVTGENKFIQPHKQPSFMDQVLKAMPASVSATEDILNQPYKDQVTDYNVRNKALGDAVNIETTQDYRKAQARSAESLANKRDIEASYVDDKSRQADEALAIKLQDANTRERLSRLKDLPDSEKERLLLNRQITLQDIRDAAAMERVERQQRGATERTGMQQAGANSRTAATVAGANQRTEATIAGAQKRVETQQTGATQRAGMRGGGASAGSYPTQQRVALQAKTSQFLNQHPEYEGYVTYNPQGFPVIESPGWGGPSKEEFDAIYEGIYGGTQAPAQQTPTATPPAPVASIPGQAERDAKFPPKPVPTKPAASTPSGGQGAIEMIAPDGSVRRVKPDQVQLAESQGFKKKTK